MTTRKSARSKPNDTPRVPIRCLPTGVPGLDEILGGGFPEYSFNIVAGAPGCGKTTMAHQFAFANATPERPAIYFTVLGEPSIKMLRYQQQFTFFNHATLDGALRFINLSQIVLESDLGSVLDQIVSEVESSGARIVVVDSFRTVARKAQGANSELELPNFVQRLALHLTSAQATTFLLGEYFEGELRDNPVFTVSDGLIWLYQSIERNSIVRKLQVMKLRGQASVPGLHTFRITENGLQCFPRNFGLTGARPVKGKRRLSTGVRDLDALMDGGIPAGDSLLLAGPSGAGKSVLASQFIAEGLRKGEPGIVTTFAEMPDEYVEGNVPFKVSPDERRGIFFTRDRVAALRQAAERFTQKNENPTGLWKGAGKFREKAVHIKGRFDDEHRIPILDKRVRNQVQRVVNSIREVHFFRANAKETRQALRRLPILGINRHLLRRDSGKRTQDRRRASHRILVKIETQFFGAAFFGCVVRGERQHSFPDRNFRQFHGLHLRTSTARACASRPSARAIVETTGASRLRPAREISCVLEHFTKSTTLNPPRARAQPEVGRT